MKTIRIDGIEYTLTKVNTSEVEHKQETVAILGLEYKTIKSSVTDRVWLDRNLGATRVAKSFEDALSYGHYLTWGEAIAIADTVKGFRVPTIDELSAELIADRSDAYSKLKLPSAGYRDDESGSTNLEGSSCFLWSSSLSGSYSQNVHFSNSSAYESCNKRASSFSIRLIKEV